MQHVKERKSKERREKETLPKRGIKMLNNMQRREKKGCDERNDKSNKQKEKYENEVEV